MNNLFHELLKRHSVIFKVIQVSENKHTKGPKNSKIWYLCKQHRIANTYSTLIQCLSVWQHTIGVESLTSLISMITNSCYITKHSSQASIVLKERSAINKFQLVQKENCHGFFFQLANSLISRFDSECILNVCHMEWIDYKWHLLCSFDETILIEI